MRNVILVPIDFSDVPDLVLAQAARLGSVLQSGTEIKHNGREYLLINESDILAVEL